MYFCSKSKDGDKKVGDTKESKEKSRIKSHPYTSAPQHPQTTDANFKLKECRPVDINPCRPPPIGASVVLFY